MKLKDTLLKLLYIAFLIPQLGYAQELSDSILKHIENEINKVALKEVAMAPVVIDSTNIGKGSIHFFTSTNCSYIPFREHNVSEIYKRVKSTLPYQYQNFRITISTDGHPIESLIPQFYKIKKDKKGILNFHPGKNLHTPLVTCVSAPFIPKKGLKNRHIALWPSHGWYYEQGLERWEWQRARLMQTVEDIYTQSYVLPYLVPMLENAGANVLLPRERDFQDIEVILDNDGSVISSGATYSEFNGEYQWEQGNHKGFAHLKYAYKNFENPFQEGTFRQTTTIRKGKESWIEWTPEIPQTGEYAVYVSYQTLPNSTDDALYTIHHQGGSTSFKVNQQMGGGTWIYLGTFPFEAGYHTEHKITLSNRSHRAGRIITGDAVKIGGGMGNIARSSTHTQPITSGYPRFCEGARYWLQWAGVPDSIYSTSKGNDDYADDYKSRGLWVNYLAGGSSSNPAESGLYIPIDMAFAFHSDAGTTPDDSIIGSLGIFSSQSYNGTYADGSSRLQGRDLTDLVLSNIVRDIRSLHAPHWSRRGMWNKPYSEANSPRVPTILLELLSHQNLADMKYGLDPNFRFTVSRAIYKGILQFLSQQYSSEYTIQPLPVTHLALQLKDTNKIELTWEPADDPLEPSAKAEKYIVYSRIGNKGFDNGTLVDENRYCASIPSGTVCSYKIVAVNQGGMSFPSEILSVGYTSQSSKKVLVINGFDRICGPTDFITYNADSICQAGFLDMGVPYMKDVSYTGAMKEFRRHLPWVDDDAPGFGESYGNYETQVIAGNSFNYTTIHGDAILKAGYSFASCSDEAVEDGKVNLKDYHVVDFILGKERQTFAGKNKESIIFKTFTKPMQNKLTQYSQQGGNIFASGVYIGSDLWDHPQIKSIKDDLDFAGKILKYKWRTGRATCIGKVHSVPLWRTAPIEFEFYQQPNELQYAVESPDGIEPAGPNAHTILRYSENNISAGIAFDGDYKTVILGFPFECIRNTTDRELLMKDILIFFNTQKKKL